MGNFMHLLLSSRKFLKELAIASAIAVSCISLSIAEEVKPEPVPETAEWSNYIAKSQSWQEKDQAAIAKEVAALGLKEATLPPDAKALGFEPKQPDEWFSSPEGERILGIILSYQTPSGGWSKRTDMAKAPREKGMAFGTEKDYIPTFDNDATSIQMELLARAYGLTHKKIYLAAFDRALQLILDAQYPNGGWPQNYPLVGGYHDHITYNDNLMRDLMEILYQVSLAKAPYQFISSKQKKLAESAYKKGLDCIKKSQVITNGERTIWGAQNGRVSLAPAKARAFEMASLATAESAYLMEFLMTIKNPDSDTINAIHGAARWFEQNKITGYRWTRAEPKLVADENAPTMWARFYELNTNKPIFGDRDNSVHYNVEEISEERRKGYAWYNTTATNVLAKYREWFKQHPLVP